MPGPHRSARIATPIRGGPSRHANTATPAAGPPSFSPPLALHAQPAPSKLDAILARGALRVGVTGDYRPFALLDKETGAFSGIDIDMANSLARGMGVKLELVQTAWGSLLPDLAADKFDVGMGGISVSLERQKTSFFSIPVLRTGKTPIARCENKAKFDTLAEIDQPGIRVITNPGGTNERYDRANLKAAQIIVSRRTPPFSTNWSKATPT